MVKEADSLTQAGYEVTVLYAYWNPWGTKLDENLLTSKKWTAKRVGGTPGSLIYFISRIIHKTASWFNLKSKGRKFAEPAIARSSYFLIREAKMHKADLYIAHNPGALPAVVQAAKKYNKPCGFDAEDFHRHEVSNDPQAPDVVLKKNIEDVYIPQINYLTVSSPLIARAYSELFPLLRPHVILNVFDTIPCIQPPVSDTQPLKLFWFSQTIGYNRGLEDVIGALSLLNHSNFELHLLGNLPQDSAFKGYLLDRIASNGLKICFHNPIHPDDIVVFASRFHIGLALEPGFSFNNEYALSNKLFTYLQAGLALVVSDTLAQEEFLNLHPDVGCVYEKGNAMQLAECLNHYHQNRDVLLRAREAAFQAARTILNWEKESLKFLKIVNQVLQP